MQTGLMLVQTQKLVMTPELLQAIRLLQLPRQELDTFIEQAVLENVALDIQEPDENCLFLDGAQSVNNGDDHSNHPLDLESYCCQQDETLYDALKYQLHVSITDPNMITAGEYLIDSLDEDGYLRVPLEEIGRELQWKPDAMQQLLELVQMFEPAGVAARNLQECLLLQIERKNDSDPLLRAMVMYYLPEVAEKRLQTIAMALHTSEQTIKKYCDVIRSLEPRPGYAYFGRKLTEYVIPDVIAEWMGNRLMIYMNHSLDTRLTINAHYCQMVNQTAEVDAQTAGYVKCKINEARWLIHNLKQRRRTLRRVAQCIVEYQHDFMIYGWERLKPLALRQVADQLAVHESTVSRTVQGKYIATPQGTYPLRYFFANGLRCASEQGVATVLVKRQLQDFIRDEDSRCPISDQQLAQLFMKRDIMLSRRTVAKYREELGIPASSRRRRKN